MASKNGNQNGNLQSIQIEVEQGLTNDGVPTLTLTVPSTGSTEPWRLVLKPAGWGLMEDAQEAAANMGEGGPSESAVVGAFLDKYVVGGKEKIPFWLGGVVFKTVTAYVKKYMETEIKN